jgi:hypothetical protein
VARGQIATDRDVLIRLALSGCTKRDHIIIAFCTYNGIDIVVVRIETIEKKVKTWKSASLLLLLEHIFKKMGSTEIVVSSVRLSVRPSVRLLFLSRYST